MAPHPYEREERIALLAVQRAARLTRAVYNSAAKGTSSKDDRSPVTVGDFGAQALVIAALRHAFPGDAIVAEEEASALRADSELREKVWERVREARLEDGAAEAELGGAVEGAEEMLAAIDGGGSEGGARGRVWALDPIDGTLGFLRGGQYAVALALVVDGDVKVGVLGCPNLPPLPPRGGGGALDAGVGSGRSGDGAGVLVSAVEGRGAVHSRPLGEGALGEPAEVRMRAGVEARDAVFCEGVEAAHSNHGLQRDIARRLGAVRESVRLDSQAKYAAVARGSADIYLRLPAGPKGKYVEKIWDHAAGDLIVREAGGVVTDIEGKRIDFGRGRLLTGNTGFVVAPAGLHAEVLKAVQAVLGVESAAL
jgi:3'(2'), 5'-bisphosphate nucleotidase